MYDYARRLHSDLILPGERMATIGTKHNSWKSSCAHVRVYRAPKNPDRGSAARSMSGSCHHASNGGTI